MSAHHATGSTGIKALKSYSLYFVNPNQRPQVTGRAQLAEHGGRDGEAGELGGHGRHLVKLVALAAEAAAGALLEVAHQLVDLPQCKTPSGCEWIASDGLIPPLRTRSASASDPHARRVGHADKQLGSAWDARCWGWRQPAEAPRHPCAE